ncbi:MAG TPA: hypothetical protein VFE61_17525 [Candidatus Sulfotelmatobacter sp.]|nr:hypothetical protein [Candidatus Sulfotelmatobacter sp.]
MWIKFIYRPAGSDEIVWNGDNPESAAPAIRLLKASITGVKCGERTLILGFSNGDQIEKFEDERYESFSIRDGKNPEIIV